MNFVMNNQVVSLIQIVDLVKFTLDFKPAFNYKLNTMSYRKFQLVLTLLVSLFFNTFFFLTGHWALKTYRYLSAMFLLANMKY